MTDDRSRRRWLIGGGVFAALAALGAALPEQPGTTPRRDKSTVVRYSSCSEAPGPLRKGEPGYRASLDVDGDGVACED